MSKAKNPRGEASGLAAVLRDAAHRSGLSVYRIAKEAGVDQSTLNKFLSGERDNLRLDVADRLFEFFGLQFTSSRRGSVPENSGRRRVTKTLKHRNQPGEI